MFPSAKHSRRFADERGFSLLQIIVVLCITGIVAGMAVFGVRAARNTARLTNSARDFAQNAEKARLDAIRRRTTTHIEFTSSNTYEITMDFAGNGTSTTRAFTLDSGVVITDSNGATMSDTSPDLPSADFDWRGRTYACNALFPMKNSRSDRLTVQIAGSGDITVNSAITGLPTVSYTTVSATSDVNPSATLTGTDTKLNLSPCGTMTTTPTPTPTPATPTPTPTPDTGGGDDTPPDLPCSLAASATTLSVQRKNGSTASLSIMVNKPGTIIKTVDANLTATPGSTETVTSSSGGTVSYSVKAPVNTWNATFPIKFEFLNCSPVTVNVSVTK